MIQELNPAKLALLYRREFEMCQVKKEETIVAVSELSHERQYVDQKMSFARMYSQFADMNAG